MPVGFFCAVQCSDLKEKQTWIFINLNIQLIYWIATVFLSDILSAENLCIGSGWWKWAFDWHCHGNNCACPRGSARWVCPDPCLCQWPGGDPATRLSGSPQPPPLLRGDNGKRHQGTDTDRSTGLRDKLRIHAQGQVFWWRIWLGQGKTKKT